MTKKQELAASIIVNGLADLGYPFAVVPPRSERDGMSITIKDPDTGVSERYGISPHGWVTQVQMSPVSGSPKWEKAVRRLVKKADQG